MYFLYLFENSSDRQPDHVLVYFWKRGNCMEFPYVDVLYEWSSSVAHRQRPAWSYPIYSSAFDPERRLRISADACDHTIQVRSYETRVYLEQQLARAAHFEIGAKSARLPNDALHVRIMPLVELLSTTPQLHWHELLRREWTRAIALNPILLPDVVYQAIGQQWHQLRLKQPVAAADLHTNASTSYPCLARIAAPTLYLFTSVPAPETILAITPVSADQARALHAVWVSHNSYSFP